jgi:hypothetical protein
MFKLIFKYTFTGLFVSHFVMLCMLITKFAYEVRPLPWLPGLAGTPLASRGLPWSCNAVSCL